MCLNAFLAALIVLFSIASLRNVTCFLSVCLLQLCSSLLLTSRVIVHSFSFHLLLWNMQVLRGFGMKGSNAVRQTQISLSHIYCYRRVNRLYLLSFLRRSQKRCVLTTTSSLTWRATHQWTTCAVRSSPSTTPPKNSGESWSKLEGWGCLTHWLAARSTGLMAK